MLQSVETPQSGWEQIDLDIFSLRNMHYLLTVDYFSQFPVVRKLQSLHLMNYTDLRQILKTTQKDIAPNENNTHMDRPKRIMRRLQRHRVNEPYLDKEYTEKICIMYKDIISSLSLM